MQTKLIEKINPFMLCVPDKFLYQNQQQTPDTSHFTLTRKSFHTSCCLQIVSTRFVSNVVCTQKIKKSWGSVCTYHALKNIHQKYIIIHMVHTRVLNVFFLYTPVRVPAGHRKTKYTSSSHQAPANQKYMQL